jgi:cysteine desulfurase
MKKVYLDYTATTPLDPQVFEAMRPYFLEKFGNASSIHHFGQEAKAALDASRDVIAKMIGATSGELFFVSSGTEADNFALKGVASKMKSAGKSHVITTSIEHHAVLESCAFLEENGITVTYAGVDSTGMIHPEMIQKALKPETGLVSVIHGNNEVGTINPISDIADIVHNHGALLHTDAVQTFGKIPLNVQALKTDLLSISAHKIYGPKGIGALFIRKGVLIDRFHHGGGQERGRRAGTESVPLAVGFSSAASICRDSMESEYRRMSELKEWLRKTLADRFRFILFNGHPTEALPNILNVSFDSSKIAIDGEALLFNLDLAGIALTSGSACTSGNLEPSHVLLAMGRSVPTAKASLRFSMGRMTTKEDLQYAVEKLEEIVRRIGKIL